MTEETEEEPNGDGITKREKILVSAVVLASILGVVGGAVAGVTILSSTPEGLSPETAPTTVPVGPIGGTAGDVSVDGISAENVSYKGKYDRSEAEPDWMEPNGFGVYVGGASVEVSMADGSDTVSVGSYDYLTYTEDTDALQVYDKNDGEVEGKSLTVGEGDTLVIEVPRPTKSDGSLEVNLDEVGAQEIWLGGFGDEPHYYVNK